MLVVSKRWLRGLLLTAIYLLGLFGIVASGGGSGSGGSISITGVHISRLYSSPTYAPEDIFSGSFSIKAPDEGQFSRTVTITWHNQLTGGSGSSQVEISGSCTFLPIPPWIFCSLAGNDEFEFWIPLDPGDNKITVTASMRGSEAQDSIIVVRTPPDDTVLPHVETQQATQLGISSIELQGIVNPKTYSLNETADVWFEYSTDPGLASADSTAIIELDGAVDVEVSATVSNLEKDMTYFYRLVAQNKYGTAWGDILNYTLPTVITSPAIQLFSKEATVSGTVNPNGYDADAWFELGFDPNFFQYVITSPIVGTGAGTIPIQVDQLFDQLSSSTEYYYRINASNIFGTAQGDVLDFVTPAAGDACWAKKYHPYLGTAILDLFTLNSVEPTSDGGFIIAARRSGTLKVSIILKTNSEGGIEWSRSLEGINRPHASTDVIKEISAGKYIAAGSKRRDMFAGVDTDYWIAELDANGAIVWKTFFGNSLYRSLVEVEILPDGYIVAGNEYQGDGSKLYDIFIAKLDQSGNMVWQNTYGEHENEFVGDIEVVGNEFVIVGKTDSFGAGGGDIWVLKLDQIGNIIWQNTYGSTDFEWPISVTVSASGITVAGTVRNSTPSEDILVLNLTDDGSINWQNTYGGKAASGISTTTDGGFILTGDPDVLLKLSNQGAIEWQKEFSGFSFGAASLGFWNFNNTVHEIPGNGFIIGALQSSVLSLIKTDTGGNCPPLDSDTSIVPSATNLVKIPSTAIRMPSNLSASPPDISEIEINTAIEQIAP